MTKNFRQRVKVEFDIYIKLTAESKEEAWDQLEDDDRVNDLIFDAIEWASIDYVDYKGELEEVK